MTPEHLLMSPESRACYQRVQSRLAARGEWREEYAFGLWPTAEACADYLSFARQVRALKNLTPSEQRNFEASVEKERASAREGLADFRMISYERVPLAAVNAEGLDAEIAALCAPLVLESA